MGPMGWTEEQSRCDGIYQGVILLVYTKLNEIIMLARAKVITQAQQKPMIQPNEPTHRETCDHSQVRCFLQMQTPKVTVLIMLSVN